MQTIVYKVYWEPKAHRDIGDIKVFKGNRDLDSRVPKDIRD